MKLKAKLQKKNYELVKEGSAVRLIPNEPLTLKNALGYRDAYDGKILESGTTSLTIDFNRVNSYDSFIVIFIESLKRFTKKNGITLELLGMSEDMSHFLTVFTEKGSYEETARPAEGFWVSYFSNMGEMFKIIFSDTTRFIEFLGEMLVKLLSLFIHPGAMRWRDFPFHFTRSGVNAVPIVILIVFLLGVITGYQGAIQLRIVGADIYIADLIGISITRELAPLMTAILVAGRSGSAFAAEIGTMKVSEEIDSLKSMGFDVVEFLVLPRVLSVMIAMPLLTLLADVAGIGGGLLMAVTTLNLTMTSYLNQLHSAISLGDIFSGIGKSVVFGFLVATVGCFRGFQVRGGAESVGRYTTASVVSGVLLIILADAVFSFIFQALGI